MNGVNSVAGAGAASGPTQADASAFDTVFETGIVSTSAILMQFIGADILQSVMKDETAVD